MTLSVRSRLGAAAVAVAAASLLAPTSAPAVGAPAAPAAVEQRGAAPVLSFKISGVGKLTKVSGPSKLRGGRVDFRVTGQGRGGTLEFVWLARGYSYKVFKADLIKAFQGNFSKWNRLLRKSKFLGGTGAQGGQTRRGSVKLPKGHVIAINEDKLNKPVNLAVGRVQKRPSVKVAGTLRALEDARFAGPSSLPRSGKLRFANRAKDYPHFVEFIRVAPGTTKQDVLDYFQSGSEEPPPWFRGEGFFMGTVSPGKSEVVNYSVRSGRYIALCFLPAPDHHGMPHAMMGMIKVVDFG